MGEHGRPIISDVLVEQDARGVMAQQSRECGFAFQKREIAQILAIMLDKVERVEDRSSSRLTTGQLLETRQAVRPQHNRPRRQS
jgi:hypothetical protein